MFYFLFVVLITHLFENHHPNIFLIGTDGASIEL